MQSGRSKVCLYHPKKSTILRLLNQQQHNLIAIFFSQINVDVHAIGKLLDLELKMGGLGDIPLEAEEFFKKTNKMEPFPLFFCFLADLPRSLKL